jgi:hypothetical protein
MAWACVELRRPVQLMKLFAVSKPYATFVPPWGGFNRKIVRILTTIPAQA